MKRKLLLCAIALASVTFASAQTARAKRPARATHDDVMIAKKKEAQLSAVQGQNAPLTQPLINFVIPAVNSAAGVSKQN